MLSRRTLLGMPLVAAAASSPTRFTYSGMTLPWSGFSFERALKGVRTAGFSEVAWGVNHMGKPLLDLAAPTAEAKLLASRCTDLGLKPVMMFSTVNLEAANAIDAHKRRIDHAAAAGIPFLLTFGKTTGGERDRFVANLKGFSAHAATTGVTVLIKQHGGNTGTGAMCKDIIEEVGHPSVKLCYDAGNVLDYESRDPIADIAKCWQLIRAFNIKDHRDWPKDEDCGPGFGEIDHYRLFQAVMNTGLEIPLTFENIFEPLIKRPTDPAAIDRLALRAREYIETVIRGLQA